MGEKISIAVRIYLQLDNAFSWHSMYIPEIFGGKYDLSFELSVIATEEQVRVSIHFRVQLSLKVLMLA
jgi:hypothetical protein